MSGRLFIGPAGAEIIGATDDGTPIVANTSLDDVRPPRTVKDMRAALLAAQEVRHDRTYA